MTQMTASGVDAVTSPVLADWFVGWDERYGRQHPDPLRPFVERLAGSRGTTDQEIVRQWLVIDWVIRGAAPLWLHAAGSSAEAARLSAARIIMDRRALTDVAEPAIAGARAAAHLHEQAWSFVAGLAQPEARQAGARPPWRQAPGNSDPRRVATWGGLADGTRAVIPSADRVLSPACRATGYAPNVGDGPVAWSAVARAIGEAAGAVAWRATAVLVSADDWSWHTPADDAFRAAQAAAGSAVGAVEAAYVTSASALVEDLLSVTAVPGSDCRAPSSRSAC